MENLILISVSKHELKVFIENAVEDVLRKESSRKEAREKIVEVLNIDGACALLDLAKPTIYTLTSKGKIPFFKRGKKLYFKRSELIQWIEQGKQRTLADEQQDMDDYLLQKDNLL